MAKVNVSQFEINPIRGFLPSQDPLRQLPAAFDAWEDVAQNLPKYLIAQKVRATVQKLPVLDVSKLNGRLEIERAMSALSFIGHAYVWGEGPPPKSIPPSLAVSWFELSQKLGRPPVLSYASYASYNWRRINPSGPIELGNIALIQNFFGGADEEWFIVIHVDIEAKAGPALVSLVEAQNAVTANDAAKVAKELANAAKLLGSMYAVLCRMYEFCDPYIYYNRVRPYIHGWKDNPALPDGLLYEGVTTYGGKPQKFRGETGSQSTLIPSFDAALGVYHKDDPLKKYLNEMRDYAPPKHKAFLEMLEQGSSIRNFAIADKANGALRDAYNECVTWVEKFRSKHLDYAKEYIYNQAQTSSSNPTKVGTGGTPFVDYLAKHRDETGQHLI